MTVIDLTRIISRTMPVYPGTDQPALDLGCTIEQHGFEERRITMFSHTGTHMDAPSHLIKGARSLDQYPADHFVGPCCVLDVRNTEGRITPELLHPFEPQLYEADFALVHTGWSRHWGEERYFEAYPILTVDAARWLAKFPLKGVGFDCISPDPMNSSTYEVHHVFLKRNMLIIENLTNVEQVPHGALFSALPLRIENADGSPVRAIAVTP